MRIRQVAVWGQVSARTLYLVVMLNVAAGAVFDYIDPGRYGPCVTVFFAIALASTAYAGWTAHRKGVDVRAPRATDRIKLVVQSLVWGVLFYLLNRFAFGERFDLGDHNYERWPGAAETIAAAAVGYGIAARFFAAWKWRQALRSQEETADDALDAPDPPPWHSGRDKTSDHDRGRSGRRFQARR